MKITCANCNTKFAIGLKELGPKGRKLKCSSCNHIWREFDPVKSTENPEPKPKIEKKVPAASPPKNDKADGSKDSDTTKSEENDQSAIDDMFAAVIDSEEIDPEFAAAAIADEENDQSAIDDMFATADDSEENDQGAIDDMFATTEDDEEDEQGIVDDLFAAAKDSEENDQSAIDDMFDNPLTMNLSEKPVIAKPAKVNQQDFEKSLPSQSGVYKKPKLAVNSNFFAWAGLAASVCLIVGIFIFGKTSIIRFFPQSAATYELYGFNTNILNLEFVNEGTEHISQDGIEFLIVSGSIINNSEYREIIPEVRAYLVDRNGNSIFSWPIPISRTTLASKQMVSFKSGTKSPPNTTQKVKVKFVIDKKLASK
ncbi:MAG: zinc-ribbon domain-containing protein [Rhizobiales bacterium]|nr:zinc-ribbon domain-containing protein [Hyphomicrobiales bacterium]